MGNYKILVYFGMALILFGAGYSVYQSGYNSGVNAEKLLTANLISDQRNDYDKSVRLVAEYSNSIQMALYKAEEAAASRSIVEASESKSVEKEVDNYVRQEIENRSVIWLSGCWIRLHDKAATIAAEMPRSDSDSKAACMDDASAAKSSGYRPEGYYSAGEALRIVTQNYEIARQWRRQLVALQERERKISELSFDNWKQLN